MRHLARLAIAAAVLVLAAPAAGSSTTLTLNMQSRLDSLDPARADLTFSWAVEYATCLKLINYADVPSIGGSTPQLEAAATYRVSSDGLTYTFVVPDGKFFFSDGEPVNAASFVRAFTRSLDPAIGPIARDFTHEIAGADAYASGTAPSISGISATGAQLRIVLTRPAPDLLSRLAMPFFCAVPASTPSVLSDTIPSAGPYYVSSADLNGLTVLKPNPFYTGKRPRHWSEIDVRAFQDGATTESQLVSGTVDWAFDGLPINDYGSFAAAHPGQLFVNPSLTTQYFILRSTRPLMSDPNMRKAFNLAIDRNALSQAAGAFSATPTDQVIPPGVPGFRDANIFPFGGDLAAARALAAPHAGETAVVLACTTVVCQNKTAIAVTALQQLGLNPTVWRVSRGDQIAIEQNPASPFDVSAEGWTADYPDPRDFIDELLHTGSVQNFSGFSDPAFDARMDATSTLAGQARYDAYAQIDEDVMRSDSPIAPYANANNRDAFSSRIGCQTFSPPFGMDLVALCLK
jgi:oligopeptide transport system substrate-binding protein